MKTNRTATITLGTGLASMAFLAAPVGAATPGLDALRTKCTSGIDKRLDTLTKLDGQIAKATNLTESHRSALTEDVATTRSGLTALNTKIAGDTDRATLKTDCTAIVNDYRVYKLVVPTVHATIGTDRAAAAVVKFGEADALLTARIEALAANGATDTELAAARAAQASAKDKVAQASALATPVADRVIPLAPADVNAGSADSVLASAKEDLTKARELLTSAKADMKAAKQALPS